jgi:hypothetical protein
MTKQETARAEAIDTLKSMVTPGDTVYTILRHASASGMSRRISTVIMTDQGNKDISYWVAKATQSTLDTNKGGIKVGGCGMDMGFSLVYNMGRALYPQGFDIPAGKRGGRNGDTSGHDNDGGYALKQEWL